MSWIGVDWARAPSRLVTPGNRRWAALWIVVACGFIVASPASAATDMVTNNSDMQSVSGSLPNEIEDVAQPGDTVEIATNLTGGNTIDLTSATSTINITENLTVQEQTPGSVTIDGTGTARLFFINDGVGTVTFSGVTFKDGKDAGNNSAGGAIYSEGDALHVIDSTFIDNAAGDSASVGIASGGAIFGAGDDATLTVSGSTFTGNTAGGNGTNADDSGGGSGGAIDNNGPTTISDSTFSGNTAGGNGGGGKSSGYGSGGAVATGNGGSLMMTNSTLTGNTAGGTAGTAENSGAGHGGAIYTDNEPTTLIDDTIDGNTVGSAASSAGSGIDEAGSVTAADSIVADNTGASNCDTQVGGSTDSLEGPAGAASCGFDLPSADPLLQGLASNAGPAATPPPQTQALPANSPAVGVVAQASCPTTVDETGDPRPAAGQSFCDIGAYELQSGFLPGTQTSVSCGPSPALAGDLSTCTVTVTGATSAPTGSVSVTASPSAAGTLGADSCTLTAVAGASTTSSCSVGYTPNAAASQTIAAEYSGGDDAASHGSTTLTSLTGTTTSISSSANPGLTGRSVTYTALVIPTPSGGTVAFTDSGKAIAGCAAAAVSNGQATCTVVYPDAGSHAIVASYSGAGEYAGSSSSTLTETVNASGTSTTSSVGTTPVTIVLSSSVNPAVTGQPVVFTATLEPAPDAGTVLFTDDGTTVPGCGTTTLSSPTGQIVCKVAFPRSGTHTILAVYSGDTADASATSAALSETVHDSLAVHGSPSASAGKVKLTLHCAADSGGCTAGLTLSSIETLKRGTATGVKAAVKTRKRTVTVGSRTITLAAGATTTVTVTLNAAGRKLLSRFHRLPSLLTVSLSVNGQHSTISTKRLTIKSAKSHR